MSSSPTFSFLHRAAFPPSSIWGQRRESVEIKEEKLEGKQKRIHIKKKKKVTQGQADSFKTHFWRHFCETVSVPMATPPQRASPKQPEPNIPQKPITFLCNRLCVSVCADCGSHSGEACVVNASLGCFGAFFFFKAAEGWKRWWVCGAVWCEVRVRP